MAMGERFHIHTRKDGVTPEFAHQVAIASHVRTLTPWLTYPEETLSVAFLHDIREDYDVSDIEIRDQFGNRVADAVDAMTKKFRGVKRAPEDVFAAIAADPCASIAKLADRVNNQQSMIGVFTPTKIASYTAETVNFFLPMCKLARRTFPTQEGAYENLKLMLTSQLELIAAIPPQNG